LAPCPHECPHGTLGTGETHCSEAIGRSPPCVPRNRAESPAKAPAALRVVGPPACRACPASPDNKAARPASRLAEERTRRGGGYRAEGRRGGGAVLLQGGVLRFAEGKRETSFFRRTVVAVLCLCVRLGTRW